jgi:uncharacterized membrane protein
MMTTILNAANNDKVRRCMTMVTAALALLLVGVFTIGRFPVNIDGENHSVLPIYFVLVGLFLGVIGIGFTGFKSTLCDKTANRRFIVIMILLALAANVAMVPLSVPDGKFHLASTMNVSNGILSMIPGLSGLAGKVPPDLLTVKPFGDGSYTWEFWNVWRHSVLVPDGGVYINEGGGSAIAYVIPAIGVSIARILHLPYQLIVLSGRWCNFAFFLVCVSCACRMTPELTKAFRAICILPATVLLACSYSYDVWNLAFCFLIVSYCVKLSKMDQVTIKDLFPFAIFTILLIPVKLIYFVLAGCIFMVKPSRIHHKKRLLVATLIFILVLVAVLMLTRGAEAISDLQGNFDPRSGLTEETSFSLRYVLRNPWKTFLVYSKTIFLFGGIHLVRSVTGEDFGAFLPSILSFAILVIFVMIEAGALDTQKVGKRRILISWLIFLLGVLIVLTSFLMIYTEIPENEVTAISGVQGRYYLPLYVLLPLMLAPVRQQLTLNKGSINEHTTDKLQMALAILSMLTSICRFVGLMLAPELRFQIIR